METIKEPHDRINKQALSVNLHCDNIECLMGHMHQIREFTHKYRTQIDNIAQKQSSTRRLFLFWLKRS